MTWIRLYITVEGHTERKFADDVLRPHLLKYSINVITSIVTTNRKLGARGGINDFDKVRGDLTRRMSSDGNDEARFTTMADLYALPADFPGWAEAKTCVRPEERVAKLEEALHAELGDRRFIPYIQLHEFEALLYCDLSELGRRIDGSQDALNTLTAEVNHLAPEEINEGPTTAPSKRIINHVPIYERSKVRVGASAAAAIGLPKLRENCPHFHNWICALEGFGSIPAT